MADSNSNDPADPASSADKPSDNTGDNPPNNPPNNQDDASPSSSVEASAPARRPLAPWFADAKVRAELMQLESHQLNACGRGFWMLGAATSYRLFVNFLLWIKELSTGLPNPDDQPRYVPVGEGLSSIGDLLLQLGPLIALLVPGALILLRQSRTVRWTQSMIWLLVAFGAEVVLLGMTGVVGAPFPANSLEDQPAWYMAFILLPILTLWVQIWFLAVLMGEFGVTTQHMVLTALTEYMGRVVLFGGSAYLAAVALLCTGNGLMVLTTIPFAALLGMASLFVLFIVILATVKMLLDSGRLAFFLSQKAQEYSAANQDPSDAETSTDSSPDVSAD